MGVTWIYGRLCFSASWSPTFSKLRIMLRFAFNVIMLILVMSFDSYGQRVPNERDEAINYAISKALYVEVRFDMVDSTYTKQGSGLFLRIPAIPDT